MISGTGIDIVEVERIRTSIEKNVRFKSLVFSADEIAYCEQQGSPYENFAGRFAAKEAFFKALGTGWRGNMAFHEVSILNDELGKPAIRLYGKTQAEVAERGNLQLHVSISHTTAYATAMVVVETLDQA